MNMPVTSEGVFMKDVKTDYARKSKFLGVIVNDILPYVNRIQHVY